MARIRTIKPGFFKSEQIAELEPMERLLFIGLWTLADAEGKLLDRPKRIKAELFPYDGNDVNHGLQKLHDTGLIIRYQHCTGIFVIKILNFLVHQRITGKEFELGSELPEPTPDVLERYNEILAERGFHCWETTGKQQGNDEDDPDVSQLPRKGKERKGKERKGSRENANGELFSKIPFQDNEPFINTWTAWETYRIEKRQKLTDTTREKQLKMLGRFPPDVAIQILEKSMTNGWTGLFEPKNQKPNEINQRSTGQPKFAGRTKADFGQL
jgi:hypothetical protein